jgi:hypothetical protein
VFIYQTCETEALVNFKLSLCAQRLLPLLSQELQNSLLLGMGLGEVPGQGTRESALYWYPKYTACALGEPWA